ncbi:MAG: 2-hydroxyacyl-CoA dehydratase [Anaerotardibacter sp.]
MRENASIIINQGEAKVKSLLPKKKSSKSKKQKNAKQSKSTDIKIAFFRYTYYDIAFKYFVEHVLDAEFIKLPEPTKRTLELGSRNSTDFVCAPFKHILGSYIEALEMGATVLVQFAGPCRLGYYGELQESILRDMGYQFTMLNFAELSGKSAPEYIKECKKINPDLNVPKALKNLITLFHLVEYLDEANDFYLANAGFEKESGTFEKAHQYYFDLMNTIASEKDLQEAHRKGMEAMRAVPLDKPKEPLRVGLVGEIFTAIDPPSNLNINKKLMNMRVELACDVTLTKRFLRYNEENLRATISDYARFDMGPTSTLTIASTKKFAESGFDGIIHLKSSGCTPEIDVIPTLQRINRETGVPILYLSYDSQTSDTGLDTRLEAFYDMIAMKKGRV